jgi:hypothetical protein
MPVMQIDYTNDGTVLGSQKYDYDWESGQIQYGGDFKEIASALWDGVKDVAKTLFNDEDLKKQAKEAASSLIKEGINAGSNAILNKLKKKAEDTNKKTVERKAASKNPKLGDENLSESKRRLRKLIGSSYRNINYGYGIKLIN